MLKNELSSEKGAVHLLLLLPVIVIIGLLASANIKTTRELAMNTSAQNVLGESEEVKQAQEKTKEEEKKAEKWSKEVQKEQKDQSKEVEKKQQEQSKESARPLIKTKTETITSEGTRSRTRIEGNKSETEIETADGQKIKTKIKDNGTTKVEIEQGKLKLKYKLENGVLKLKAENESGQDVDLKDDKLSELENRAEDQLGKEGIKVGTGSGKPVFAKNNIAATTDFPLSIDVNTNQLVVNTPAGQKIVTVLPDQAVQHLLATNIINKIDNKAANLQSANELGSLNGVVKLEIRNGEVIYRVEGSKAHKLLGFITVNTPTTAFVSAQSGDLVAQEQSLLTNIVDLLSP